MLIQLYIQNENKVIKTISIMLDFNINMISKLALNKNKNENKMDIFL